MFPPPSALLAGRQQDTKRGVGDSSGGFQSRACWGLQGGRRGGLRQGPLQAQMTQLPLGAGYRVKEACGELTGTVCAPCDLGTYTAHLNGLSECLQCRVCDPGRTPGHSHHPTGDPRPAAVGSHGAGTAVPHPTSSAGQASAREPFQGRAPLSTPASPGDQHCHSSLFEALSRVRGARHPEPLTWTPKPRVLSCLAHTAGPGGLDCARPQCPHPHSTLPHQGLLVAQHSDPCLLPAG